MEVNPQDRLRLISDLIGCNINDIETYVKQLCDRENQRSEEERRRDPSPNRPRNLIDILSMAIAQPDVFDLPGLLEDCRNELTRNRELFSRLVQVNETLTSTVRTLSSIASLDPDRTP